MAAAALDVIGRDVELGAIEDMFREPTEGPSALVLEGEAGIGKTTLWERGVAGARDRGYLVLSCRPAEAETGLPFASLGELLEPVLADVSGELAPRQLLALETALALVEPHTSFDQLAISRAALAALRSLAASNGLVLAVDDVQWLEPATAQVLEFSVRRLADAPVRFLVSGRGDGAGAPPLGLDRALPPEALAVVRLGPLSPADLGRLVRTHLDIALPRSRLAELHRITGGNPFYALQIAGQRADPDEPLTVPESVGHLLRARLADLSPSARHALLLTAASPQPTADIVERAAGGDEGLAELLGAGFVALDAGRIRLLHPLLGSAAYESAPAAARHQAHAALADVVDDPEERALHLALATERPDEAVAAELDDAASRAYRRGAPGTAAQLSEHALRLSPEEPAGDRLRRGARSAEYHLACGDTERGRSLLEAAVAALPPGPARAPVLLRLGRVRYVSDDVPAAQALLEQALVEAGEDARLRAAIEQALAFLIVMAGGIPSALARARSALELAERLHDRGLLALALGRVASTEFLAGLGLDTERLERAVELEQYVDDVPVEWLPSYVYGSCALWADDLETPRRLFDRLYRSALERGDERATAMLLWNLSQLECATGDWSRAAQHAAEAVERSRQSGLATLQTNALSAQAYVSALRGDAAAARAAAAEGIRISQEAGAVPALNWHLAALGFLELSLGDPAGAHVHLGPLSTIVVQIGLVEPGVVRFLPDEIEALIALGELEAAEAPLRQLEERGRALDRVWALAVAGRCRALLESARGNVAAARASLAEALARHQQLGQPFELGRTLLAQGAIERRAKGRAAARRALMQALDLFDTLGAPLWAEQAAVELAHIPGRASAGGELSETERGVAGLVAEGLSNREIAARLHLSVRTVEWNLSKVYSKLGIRSRTELARRLCDP
jgi:DNA-binding CsgD family transcriptional regulator